MKSQPKNQHLNVFRFFNESTEKEFIENNLSRAFSICLSNSSFFLSEYIQAIVTAEDYQYLFSSIGEDTTYSVDIQVDTATIEKESFSKVYAVAMTADKDLDMDDFFEQPEFNEKKNITDIVVSIKDIAIIIEVKRTSEDCKAQLFNQALPFINGKQKVIPKRFSWQETVKLMETIRNIQHLVSKNSVFISDFLQLSEIRFPDWFEPKPFNVLPFSSKHGDPNYVQLAKRMRQALSASKYNLLGYTDRLGISVPFGWASEIIPEFQSYDDEHGDYVVFYIWPGNTKQQGYQIYNGSMNWQGKTSLTIDKVDYQLEVVNNVKLCHFNRYVSGINFTNKDLRETLHTSENFHNESGKWDIEKWGEFERLLDRHFNPEFNWRERCDWKGNFLSTDRSYFTMSLGYEVSVFIPYSDFKSIDKNDNDVVEVSKFLDKISDAFKTLIS